MSVFYFICRFKCEGIIKKLFTLFKTMKTNFKIDIKSWGPSAWNFLTSVALTYPVQPTPEDKSKYKFFLNSVADVLPCKLCGKHFKEHMDLHPLTDQVLSGPVEMARYINKLHNEVNQTKKKPDYSFYKMLTDYAPRNFYDSKIDEKEMEKLDTAYEDRIKASPESDHTKDSNEVNNTTRDLLIAAVVLFALLLVVLLFLAFRKRTCIN